MTAQIRPRSAGSDAPFYSPDRDLAYITPTLMRAAMMHLDKERWSPELAAWLSEHELTEEHLAAAVKAFVEAHRDFISLTDPVETPGTALAQRGFFDVAYGVRQAVFASVGEVLVGAWFKAVRDVTKFGEESPCQTDIAEFVAAGCSVARKLNCGEDHEAATQRARVECEILGARVSLLQNTIREQETQLIAKSKSLAERQVAINNALVANDAVRESIQRIESLSLWGHIWLWWIKPRQSKRS